MSIFLNNIINKVLHEAEINGQPAEDDDDDDFTAGADEENKPTAKEDASSDNNDFEATVSLLPHPIHYHFLIQCLQHNLPKYAVNQIPFQAWAAEMNSKTHIWSQSGSFPPTD